MLGHRHVDKIGTCSRRRHEVMKHWGSYRNLYELALGSRRADLASSLLSVAAPIVS